MLQALSVGLEQSPDFLLSKHAHMLGPGNESTLRLLYYPPLGAPVQGLTRCGAHCDYGTFTLLAQVCRLQQYFIHTWSSIPNIAVFVVKERRLHDRKSYSRKYICFTHDSSRLKSVINSTYLYNFVKTDEISRHVRPYNTHNHFVISSSTSL